MQERPGEQMEQMLLVLNDLRPHLASVFIVEAEVRLCLGKRKPWQNRL